MSRSTLRFWIALAFGSYLAWAVGCTQSPPAGGSGGTSGYGATSGNAGTAGQPPSNGTGGKGGYVGSAGSAGTAGHGGTGGIIGHGAAGDIGAQAGQSGIGGAAVDTGGAGSPSSVACQNIPVPNKDSGSVSITGPLAISGITIDTLADGYAVLFTPVQTIDPILGPVYSNAGLVFYLTDYLNAAGFGTVSAMPGGGKMIVFGIGAVGEIDTTTGLDITPGLITTGSYFSATGLSGFTGFGVNMITSTADCATTEDLFCTADYTVDIVSITSSGVAGTVTSSCQVSISFDVPIIEEIENSPQTDPLFHASRILPRPHCCQAPNTTVDASGGAGGGMQSYGL